ncbi:MAG: hypothetical protein KatS3mg029_0802 [Saprospiraceae bacterium]|nr:MAG: hypothetical protein KatS3mg029_0802 [Saprospiraceae bacterium]
MHPFQKNILLIFCLALIAAMQACQSAGNESESPDHAYLQVIENMPPLLDRPEAIRYGKEWDQVQNAYGKALAELSKNPQAKEPRLLLSEIFIQEARITGEHPHYYPAALQVLDELLAMPFDVTDIHQLDIRFRALLNKANVQLSLHDFAGALQTANEALALNPHNAAIYGVLVDANVELGNYEQAVEMADKMVSIRPDLRSYSRVSYLREMHGDLPGAIEAMTMAVKAGSPGSEQTSWALLTLGKLYEKQGNMQAAETQYLTILDYRPNYPFALAALANLAYEEGRYQKAEQLFQQAADIIPEVGFYEGLAKVYKATGRQDAFDQTFDEIIAMMQDDEAHGHDMSLEFARAYADLKEDYATALTHALKEYEKRPENVEVNALLASLYYRMGDTARAVQHRQKAVRLGSVPSDLLALGNIID